MGSENYRREKTEDEKRTEKRNQDQRKIERQCYDESSESV